MDFFRRSGAEFDLRVQLCTDLGRMPVENAHTAFTGAYLAATRRFAELGKRLRHFTILIALFWFNFEIWGRVVWTIVTWGAPAA